MPIYLQHGNLIDYVPPTDTSTEDVVFMGGLVGIPQTFIPAGELGALSVDGVYMFTKKDGVSVNLGDVVKYCGTTKLAQDSNADLTLGVAVAKAEADSLGVKVKINSVLPTDGGGGGGEVAIDTSRGLSENSRGVGINIGSGLYFGSDGKLTATGGGGGGIQNLATGMDALSILGAATTSDYSVTIGVDAQVSATAQGGIAIGKGAEVATNGCGSIAIGLNAKSCSPSSVCGNIIIGNGSNPYSDSALLVVGGNGYGGPRREGILLYGQSSSFLSETGSEGAGIAFVTTADGGATWTLQNDIKFTG